MQFIALITGAPRVSSPSIGAYQNLTSPKSDKHLAPGLWPVRSGKHIGATSCPIVDR